MEQEKQVVYFSDLFFTVLKRWKSMLIFAVVFALALGGLGVLKNSNGVDIASDHTVASIAYNQEQADIISTNILNQQKYMTESVLMTMDPYNSGKVTIDVYVYTDYQIMPGMEYQNTDKTIAVMRSYITVLQSPEAQEAFCAATGLSSDYVAELISTEIIANSNLLSISVRCPDVDTAKKLAEAVTLQLEGAKADVESRITTHQISISSTPSADPVDLDVAKAQADAALRLTNLQLSLDTVKTELKTLQNYAADNKTFSTPVLALVGAIVGVFLVVAFAVVQHLGSDRIYSGRVLENRVDIRVLGALPQKKTWLHKAEGRATEALYDVLAMNIRNYCGEEKQVLLLGDLSADHKTALTEQLQKLGITAIFDGSLLTCASSLDHLRSNSAVVLIYTCNKSLYSHAEKEIRMINDQEKTLAGCILIDG